MATVKTIKDVDEEAWLEFKSIAARNKMRMGKLFEEMVDEYKERSSAIWNNVLNPGKILSDKEAEDMEKLVGNLRKEKGFRQ